MSSFVLDPLVLDLALDLLSFDVLLVLELDEVLSLEPLVFDPPEFESVELALDALEAFDLLTSETSLLKLEPLSFEPLSALELVEPLVLDALKVVATEQLVPEFATLELVLDSLLLVLLFPLDVDDVPVVQLVKADDSFTEVAADDADRVAPSTSDTSLGHPWPAPVALGITEDFSATLL